MAKDYKTTKNMECGMCEMVNVDEDGDTLVATYPKATAKEIPISDWAAGWEESTVDGKNAKLRIR